MEQSGRTKYGSKNVIPEQKKSECVCLLCKMKGKNRGPMVKSSLLIKCMFWIFLMTHIALLSNPEVQYTILCVILCLEQRYFHECIRKHLYKKLYW